MFTHTDIARGIVIWAEKASATILEQKQTIDSQAEEIESRDAKIAALELMLSPPAFVPVADVPVRVLSLAINEELEPE